MRRIAFNKLPKKIQSSLRPVSAVIATVICFTLPAFTYSSNFLTLNGLSVHKELRAEYFVAGLYLTSSSKRAKEILTMPGDKRMEMRITHDRFSPRKFASLWRESLVINNSPEDIERFGTDMLRFSSIMKGKLVTGDQVVIEYREQRATVVSVNGNELAQFDAQFFHLLLNTWIGPRPASSDFKKGLLAAGKPDPQLKSRFDNIIPLDGRKKIASMWGGSSGGAAAKAEAQARAQAEAEAQAEAIIRAEAEGKARAEAEARQVAQARAEAEALARKKAKAKALARAQAQAEARAEAEAKAQTEAKARAEAAKKAQALALAAEKAARSAALAAKSDAQAQANALAKAKAASEAKAKAEAISKARAQAETKAKAAAKARAQAEANAREEAKTLAIAEAKALAKAKEQAKKQAEATAKALDEAEARAQAEAKALDEAKKRAEQAALAQTNNTGEENSEDLVEELSEIDIAKELYKSKLVAWVYKYLEYPDRDRKRRNEGEIRLKVTINREGALAGKIEVLKKARHSSLNAAAKRAVNLAQRYPEIPESISGETFTFEIPILFRRER